MRRSTVSVAIANCLANANLPYPLPHRSAPLVAVYTPRPTGVDRCKDLYHRAWQQLEQGHYEAALNTFQDLLVVSDRCHHAGLQRAAQNALQELRVAPVAEGRKTLTPPAAEVSIDAYEQLCAHGDRLVAEQQLAAARVAYQAALPVAAAHDNAQQTGRGLTRIGQVYQAEGDYERAAGYFRSAAHILSPEEVPEDTAIAYYHEGLCHYAQHQYGAALESFKAALEHWQGVADTLEVALTLDYLGRVYAQQQDYWLALGSFEAALDVLQQLSTQQDVRAAAADLLAQIASLCEQTRHWELAIAYWLDVLALYEDLDATPQGVSVRCRLGHLHQHLGQGAIGRSYFQSAAASAH